ncbi:hypothetical protein ACFX13_045969 [Malus domestica]
MNSLLHVDQRKPRTGSTQVHSEIKPLHPQLKHLSFIITAPTTIGTAGPLGCHLGLACSFFTQLHNPFLENSVLGLNIPEASNT